MSQSELKQASRVVLFEDGPPGQSRVLREFTDLTQIFQPKHLPDYMDTSRILVQTVDSRPNAVHPWAEPARDRSVRARLYSRRGELLGESSRFCYGFMEKPPEAEFPAVIHSTSVDQRGYLRINEKPYFPVYWSPNMQAPFEGNYPPRLHGARSHDLNNVIFPKGELSRSFPESALAAEVSNATADPHFFGYEVGDGEMQLQGWGWRTRLDAVKPVIAWLHKTDPQHVVNGPESWLVGHPGRDGALRAFVPYFDVVGAECSYEEVPLVNQYARPYYGQGHNCAVLAGLEAYFYPPVESLRWRGYRSIIEGCSGVGLCPSEMLRAGMHGVPGGLTVPSGAAA